MLRNDPLVDYVTVRGGMSGTGRKIEKKGMIESKAEMNHIDGKDTRFSALK